MSPSRSRSSTLARVPASTATIALSCSAITKSDSSQPVVEAAVHFFDDWFDPIEAGVRDRVRGFIQAMIEGERMRH